MVFTLFPVRVCTFDLKPRGVLSDGTVHKFMHYAQETKFSDHKSLNVQNVHNSVSCAVVFMKHIQSGSSCTIVLLFVHHINVAEKRS